jgi:hypothetical protein
MAIDVEKLLREARGLAPDERVKIVTELLATLEPDVPGANRSDRDWLDEIERRARAAISGAPGLSWKAARAAVQKRLSNQ